MINKTSFSYHICSIVVSAKATTNLYNKKVQLFKYIHSYVLACLSTYFLLTYNSKLERGLITPQNIAICLSKNSNQKYSSIKTRTAM